MKQIIDIPKYHKEDDKYILDEGFIYKSARFNKFVVLDEGYESDGATGALDIPSAAWWVHDKLCEDMRWDDGTHCTRWQGSIVISDILRTEGRWARKIYWKYATYLPKVWDDMKSLVGVK